MINSWDQFVVGEMFAFMGQVYYLNEIKEGDLTNNTFYSFINLDTTTRMVIVKEKPLKEPVKLKLVPLQTDPPV